MKNTLTIEEMKDISFKEIVRKDCEDEVLSYYSELIGEGETAIIPMYGDTLLVYSAGVPLRSYRLRYSHYYYDKLMLTICLTGKVVYDNGYWFSSVVENGQGLMYDVAKDQTYIQMEEGKRFENVSLVFSKEAFYECLDRFFDDDSRQEKEDCIKAFFSEKTSGRVFDISKEIKIICKQILSCRLRGNFRRVFLECKLFELLAYYFQSITHTPEQKIRFSAEDIQKLQQAKKLLSEQQQILTLSVEKICREVGLNRFKLNMGFQSIFNISVIKFYRTAILNKAYSELSYNWEANIEDIALRFGYGSVQAFSNAFYKEFGVRPSEVKKYIK